MKTTELTVTRIGNSKGIRIPSRILKKYGFKTASSSKNAPANWSCGDTADQKLSWRETFEEMARETEDWSDFEAVIADQPYCLQEE